MSRENLNDLLKNPPFRYSLSMAHRVYDIPKCAKIINERVTQSESQKYRVISTILSVLDKSPANTTTIMIKSGLSWNAIISTLKLFREKKIVTVKQPRDKQNNEKIYFLKRELAIAYHEKIWLHKDVKRELKWRRGLQQHIKIWDDILLQLPQGWENWYINLTPEEMKLLNKKEKRMRIEDFPPPFIKRLMTDYNQGIYCEMCFKEGDRLIPERISDTEQKCPRCHIASYYNEITYPSRREIHEDKKETHKQKSNARLMMFKSWKFIKPRSVIQQPKRN